MKRRELLEIPMPDVRFRRIDIEAYERKHPSYNRPYYVVARIVPGEFGDTDSEVITKADGAVITNPATKYRSDKSSGILCIWLFSEKKQPLYNIYACADSCEWRVYNHNNEKWQTAMLCNLTGYSKYHEYQYIYADAASATLGHYFGSSDPDTLRALDDFQRDNRTYRTKIALLKSRRNIDALMASVPPLPGGIDRYIDNHVLRECRYLWYLKEGKTLVGLCTHCGKTTRTEKYPKGRLIGTRWKCPSCGSEVTMKAVNFSASERNTAFFSVLQNVPDGVMVTEYAVHRWNDRPMSVYDDVHKALTRNPLCHEHCYVRARAHIKYSGHTDYYIYETRHDNLNGYKPDWYVFDGSYDSRPSPEARLFPGNIKRVLADTPWKYSGLEALAKSDKAIDVSAWFDLSRRMPSLEKLAKLGLYNLALASAGGRYYGDQVLTDLRISDDSSLCEILRINKAELRMFREVDITSYEVELYRQMKAMGKRVTAKDIRELRSVKINESGLVSTDNRHVYITDYVTLHKVAKYVREQRKNPVYEGIAEHNILSDWNDYLIECLRLSYDLNVSSVVMPKDLHTAHARTSELMQHKKNKKFNTKIKKRCTALGDVYALERDGYVIRMAASADELVYEGKIQNICVGSYGERYADGKCTILFLRKSDAADVPFVTIEVREHPDSVEDIQIRCKRNRKPDDDTMKWWNRYKKDVLSKLGGKPYAIEHGNKEKISACAG